MSFFLILMSSSCFKDQVKRPRGDHQGNNDFFKDNIIIIVASQTSRGSTSSCSRSPYQKHVQGLHYIFITTRIPKTPKIRVITPHDSTRLWDIKSCFKLQVRASSIHQRFHTTLSRSSILSQGCIKPLGLLMACPVQGAIILD